ncbi:MAG TPA: YciI family protein [Cellvibrionaceae bacterium]|nr:YciI family protein [Cellvibrionaceae bacterium]
MKYLCLVYCDEHEFNRLSPSEWQALNERCVDCVASLQNSGHYIAGDALHPVATATSVRLRDGKVLITDGPFAETKEQLAGYYLLEARDLNEALLLAQKIPAASMGCIEVRPVRTLDPTRDERINPIINP